MSKRIYLTTAIPYVNGDPHIGHVLELVQSDVLARFGRLSGKELLWGWGTDENSLKNVQAAEKEGIGVADLVKRNADKFFFLKEKTKLNLSFDSFIRTGSDPRHITGAQKLWKSCAAAGDIYKKSYEGLYCVGCEEFKTEKDLVNGECIEHPGKKVEKVQEENYFFRLSRYQSELQDLIASGRLAVVPETRKNEMLSFIERGLEDFSISRSRARARGWGIPVPDDPTQIQYVWFDALSNYITQLGYADDSEEYHKWWVDSDERVHVIGKGIARFHSIYWPAILLSAGVPLPTTVFVHGYVTVGGQKMSKSLGNVIDPMALIAEYGTDAVRYFLSREVSTFEDSDITLERFKEAYNANLANGLGNLVARVMKMAEDNLDGPAKIEEHKVSDFPEYEKFLDNYEINKVADYIWAMIKSTDEFIQKTEPFKTIKTNPEQAKKDITHAVHLLSAIAFLLQPFLPSTAEKIQKAIAENKKPETLFARK